MTQREKRGIIKIPVARYNFLKIFLWGGANYFSPVFLLIRYWSTEVSFEE